MTFIISVTEFSKVDRFVNDLRREIAVCTLIQQIVKRNGGMSSSVVTISASTAIYKQAKANLPLYSVDKKNQLDVTFCILYFSSNSFSTCFGQPSAHHQDLTTAWCYSLVLVCTVAAGRLSSPMDALPANRTWQPPCSHCTYQHEAITSRSRQLKMMGTWLPETCWAIIRIKIKNTKSDI